MSLSTRSWNLVALAIVGVAVILWWRGFASNEGLVAVRREPVGVMGTESSIIAVVPRAHAPRAARILDAAEGELRRLESMFSTWIEASEMSRLNAAGAAEPVTPSGEILQVLSLARRVSESSGGAFDPTAAPLFARWRRAGRDGTLPAADELEALRGSSTWADLEIRFSGEDPVPTAIKRRATLRLDLDGVAKGFAIDRAVAALEAAGAVGGMVEVGGDLRVFGPAPDGGSWPVAIRDPFADAVAGAIDVADRAACTSGGYARWVEIAGRRYSHIVDPRTSRPAEAAASVTVLAADTATADAWATALTVLGPDGLELLPTDSGVEALVVTGEESNARAFASAGFPKPGAGWAIPIARRP